MMRATPTQDPRNRLLPEGRRWGFGAHSVVAYLTHSRAATEEDVTAAIRNPVFQRMDDALRALRQRH
jgi:hypothetical protein